SGRATAAAPTWNSDLDEDAQPATGLQDGVQQSVNRNRGIGANVDLELLVRIQQFSDLTQAAIVNQFIGNQHPPRAGSGRNGGLAGIRYGDTPGAGAELKLKDFRR